MHKQLREHGGQLASLRQIYTEQQERTRRLEEGYDWTITKQFCFRFIRILDSLAERIDTLPEDADETHRRQLRELHDEVLFALEASGIEQFTPDARSPFAGNEKRFKVVGKTMTKEQEDHGLVSGVLSPGYLLSQEGRPDRILRPAHVEVFEAMQLQEAAR